jgi:hypothetical protein
MPATAVRTAPEPSPHPGTLSGKES